MKSFKSWIYYYVKKYGFIVSDLNYGDGFRIKNIKGEYVDYWKTGSYRSIDGKHHRAGSTRRGYGHDESYDYTQAPIEEIKKLI
jgi:hypothetical protein